MNGDIVNMVRKIIIIVCMLTAICLVIIQPGEIHSLIESLRDELGGFGGYVFLFYYLSATLLFWIGVPAGWNFAKERFLGGFGGLICVLIGMNLSPIIALFQLLKPKE